MFQSASQVTLAGGAASSASVSMATHVTASQGSVAETVHKAGGVLGVCSVSTYS